ncbi:MAG: hypothetical protein A3A80_02660 [Candidatus Terrybacteria bacterium RIFCSPLOWO2_01_FULL_44_24]|uniref:Prokaryotic-type class I peptide chain release factors domain-containing protein n=1 Tax=Candidatus Terrybacteria bacterium RIFCSPHIGHO2_01_FULL_43_35 TaxID=1802361 RepID=A0A1G2PEK3_9BACT|nr:MAG: hypothetical protein A2828_02455 [Candidatus Terrybacteria bacterium RIFCSPHIGHO2_01_FULL_43_35]OHA50314.1 MAG: hypothetical protein A3B75_00540 [Candidatus Terrybacteria bacterium RIFCSPHIGHO2_02_FULL_43_14]OHA51047.1 MAG: hypothetical protein A3A80_02660 [Candidatus Terrybacteria bacterium RIFCSPLOWO2_01_FULL_44_24]
MPQETAPPDDKTPAQNITFESSHSSGPGGQNVNKRETKVRARWNFENDPALTEDQKQRIRSAYPGRVTEAGELIVESQSERSRDANQRKAAARLLDLIARALEVAPERQETKVPFSAKRARLEEKHHTAAKKELRKKVDEW